jgi:hypothetical protein
MAGCFTCEVNLGERLAPGGTIYEDEYWLADHGVSRLIRGYVVLKHLHWLSYMEPFGTELAPSSSRLAHCFSRFSSSFSGTCLAYSRRTVTRHSRGAHARRRRLRARSAGARQAHGCNSGGGNHEPKSTPCVDRVV